MSDEKKYRVTELTQENARKAFDCALNYLSFKARTEQEVLDHLEKKGFVPRLQQAAVKKLRQYHYVDDEKYLEDYCYQNAMGKGFSRKRVRQELSRRGLSEDLLARLEELIPPEDERLFCERAYEKVLKKTEGEPYRRRLQKISDYLMRRQFDREEITHCVNRLDEQDCPVDEKRFEKHLEHYRKLYARKGLRGRELRSRMTQALLGRGYPYELVKSRIEEVLREAETEVNGDFS